MNVSSPKFDLRANTFLKAVIIKNGLAQFTHKGESFRLTSPCFKDLENKTVMINSAFEVFRSDKKLGDATRTIGQSSDEPDI